MGQEDSRMIESSTSMVFLAAGAVIVVFVAIAFIRIVRGPTAPDRVVALDTINTLVVALLICLSAGFRTLIYLDIAIVYALLSFVTTLYISHYLGDKA
jgi:multicomponent Na+:H+ antiporter subunit F